MRRGRKISLGRCAEEGATVVRVFCVSPLSAEQRATRTWKAQHSCFRMKEFPIDVLIKRYGAATSLTDIELSEDFVCTECGGKRVDITAHPPRGSVSGKGG